MATTTLCQSGAALLKAGANRSSSLATLSGANVANLYVDELINQAESVINAVSRKNWSAEVSAGNVSQDTSKILEDWCSNLTAMYLIEYDMSGFTSRREAETMLDVLNNANTRNQSLMRDQKEVKFVEST